MFGFTLFELVIVVTLVFVAGLIIIPSYRGYALNNELVVTRSVMTQAFNQAQNRARSGEGDSDWGVHLESGKIIVFKGSSFSLYNPATDVEFVIPTGVIITGITDIVFSKLSGLPDWSGEIVLSNNIGQLVVLDFNTQGVTTY